jgi:hypothetical protein
MYFVMNVCLFVCLFVCLMSVVVLQVIKMKFTMREDVFAMNACFIDVPFFFSKLLKCFF